LPYAGFRVRFGSFFLDTLILVIANLLLRFALGFNLWNKNQDLSRDILSNLISVAGSWLYYALLESTAYQATLGKQMAGIVVTDLTGNR
jgi:uncharacterized RDD family membrane protein YckC